MQYFKGDATEIKMAEVLKALLDDLALQKTNFFDDSYECFILGEVIWDSGRSPLSNAIKRTIFREAFQEIFTAFVHAGTFESYISVFTKIFGEDAEFEFTVPAPGKLTINIEAAGIELSPLIARTIVDNTYTYDEVIDYDTDNIVLQTIKGFQSQYELEQMLFEMVPAGVFTTITLDLGV